MTKEAVEATPSILTRLARSVADADREVEEAEAVLKKAKAKAAMFAKKLVEEMITQQVASFRTVSFGGFRTQAVVYPNMKDRAAFDVYMKRKKLEWLMSRSLNSNKLRSFVKELLEQGKPVPPGIEPYTTTEIRRFK